ncbi:probable WRKY transcription factor 51 [Henckelia pumila]|uniref:probable WRKY transcription factor 51 n=1 Tax=Henckelia pumila TaxID=405737 RepID=UPI003C6DE547
MIMAQNPDPDIFHATFWPQCFSGSMYSLKTNFEVSELSEFNGYFAEENPAFASLPEAYISQNSNSMVNDDGINFAGSNSSFHESSSNNVMPDAVNVITRESDKQKKVTREKIAFKTESDIEILDDGFKWRKYGKKMVKSSPNPRNYYKCAVEGCPVKKRVDRDKEDSRYVITTYEAIHNHQGHPQP